MKQMVQKCKIYSKKNFEAFDNEKIIRVFYELSKTDGDKKYQIYQEYNDFLSNNQDDLVQRLKKETNKILENKDQRQFDIYQATLERLLSLSVNETDFLKKQDKQFRNQENLPLVILLDQIRSAHNVGAIFRNAECFGADEVILNFPSPTPENPSVKKTAMGCEEKVKWSETQNPIDLIVNYKEKKYEVISLEITDKSMALENYSFKDDSNGVMIILGHEQYGVSEQLLKLSDAIVHIDLFGTKNSLNVACASAILMQSISSILRRKLA